eukprot:m.234577 g.234577  ORF g.234577 m.234577 type:complete len:182 (-) comp17388_c0_seq1:3459-4004(-)
MCIGLEDRCKWEQVSVVAESSTRLMLSANIMLLGIEYQAVIPDLQIPPVNSRTTPPAGSKASSATGKPARATKLVPLDNQPHLAQLLQDIDSQHHSSTLQFLATLLRNLIQNPTEFKYQRINMASQAVGKRFSTASQQLQLQQLLVSVGFEPEAEGNHLRFAKPTLEASNLYAVVTELLKD